LSHCAPQSVVAYMCAGTTESDKLTLWFEELQSKLDFRKWFFGHYHADAKILDKYILLYDQIIRIK
ncbi:MAG: metallophosphatase, partial [Ruminococcus bromii]|nr:metallophosphatase [Ruminococcus bromii]